MLWRNFFRDLKSTLSRLVSVIFITMIAVMVYVALNGIFYNVAQINSAYFDGQNVADYWITGTDLDRRDCRVLEQIPGVTGVQPRLVFDANKRGDESVTLALYAVAEDYSINTPYLVEGRLPAGEREMVISDQFASAHGLEIGDFYEMTIPGAGLDLRLQICGLVKDPECMRHINATTPMPDPLRYGFAYLNETVLSALMGANRYNQICITVSDEAEDRAIRQEIDQRLGEKVVNVLAMEDNMQVYAFQGTTDDLTPVLKLFPVLFFLCAVLLMVSNMSRLIENARSSIGTFKALGYYDSTIMGYYLLHAVLVVLVGFPLGVLPSKLLIRLIVETLSTGSDLPAYQVVWNYKTWAEAFLITAVCCIGSAWLVARSELKENPAQCMRPKPPKSTKPVLLERIKPLWRRLGFNQKYIIRSTLRNKPRMLTCVFGIAFCMALVFAAFALRDSITHYADALTQNQNRYDIMVDLSTYVTERQYSRLWRLDMVDAAEYEMTTACWFYSEDQLTTATLTVAEDQPELRLYDPYAPDTAPLPADGMVLEESVAQALDVSAGDTVMVRFTGDPRFYPILVSEIQRCVSGAYVGRSLWRSLGLAYVPTTAYLATDQRQALAAELDRYDFVDAWQTRESVTDAAAETLSSSSLVAYILILFGGGLACVVIYNLGIMSFFEQIRSLATLMVLGFYDREIKRLQLSENIIFALAGIVLGLPFGILLSHLFVAMLTTMPLEVATKPLSFVLSCAITLLFALLVNRVIGRKMRDIDMLGALKSVE